MNEKKWRPHPESASSKIPKELLAEADKLLDGIVEDREGFDTAAIETFLSRRPMRRPYRTVLLDNENFVELSDRIQGARGVIGGDDIETIGGFYRPDLDIVVLRRDREKEKLNGTLYTESLLIHELAHASSGFPALQYGEDDDGLTQMKRQGFAVVNPGKETSEGSFLEEGFAEWLRGHFVYWQAAGYQSRCMIKEFMPPNWPNQDVSNYSISRTLPNGEKLIIPGNYLYKKSDKIISHMGQSAAGVAFERILSEIKRAGEYKIEEIVLKARHEC